MARHIFFVGFCCFAALALLGWVCPSSAQENLPDGGQAKDMIDGNTQKAIDAGLSYLANSQHADGSFGTGQQVGNVAITSLAGLAFMAGGHQPGRGRYGRAVTNAVRYVISKEDRNQPGFLCNRQAAFHGPMYGHGFATLFLAEAHGMVNQKELRDELKGTLTRAVKLIIDTQNNEGGWRYQPVRGDADLSVTICQIMALRAARNSGLHVPKSVADKCIKYVKDCQDLRDDRSSGGFRYQRHGGPPGFARTAAGIVALYSAGLYEGKEVDAGLKYLMQHKPGNNRGGGGNIFGGNFEAAMHYYYGHYYAVQATWIAGGNYWKEWYPAIRNELLNSKESGGTWWDGRFCKHYCTSMALIILQVPNNYLPIMQR